MDAAIVGAALNAGMTTEIRSPQEGVKVNDFMWLSATESVCATPIRPKPIASRQ